ncbi:MAG: DNA methyltransferase [Isosphaera sp.]|nr:DNA methyltransferase [Isosphaera sp.]
MSTDTAQIVARAWNFAHVLRDVGLSYLAYTEQITFLLFLKMAHELTLPPHNRPPIVPEPYDWPNLLKREGDDLEVHYRHTLEELGKRPGMLGQVFLKARPDIQNPALLYRLIRNLIEPETWTSLEADVKGDIYEGLLARSAEESPKGAGQYFTPRPLIRGIVDCVRPTADDTVCDPACGTGGFLLAAREYVQEHEGRDLDPDQKRHLRRSFATGWELVPNTARLCVMNLYLHGVDADPSPVRVDDSLRSVPADGFTLVLTNPPFGKKSSIKTRLDGEDDADADEVAYERPDFVATTKNKQLNFLQHVLSLLKVGGRCAVVVPDNVLFEGGAGEKVRRALLRTCDVHTLLRLPTGIFYAQGVKANVLFFDRGPPREEPWTSKLWVYDLRTNRHFTLKTNPLRRSDLDEFVACYRPEDRAARKPTWDAGANPDGRWRAFEYAELAKRDKANLDIFWLRDKTLEESEDLPEPDTLAREIADDLQAAADQFAAIVSKLGE